MQRWNWFINVDFRGDWISTRGIAEVVQERNLIKARLLFKETLETYCEIDATLDSEEWVVALVKSSDRDVNDFQLQGQLFRSAVESGEDRKMVLLTDGTTVLGMASIRTHREVNST